MYIARPFVPINLDIVILIIRPKIFVIKPPIKRIIVDLINLSLNFVFILYIYEISIKQRLKLIIFYKSTWNV